MPGVCVLRPLFSSCRTGLVLEERVQRAIACRHNRDTATAAAFDIVERRGHDISLLPIFSSLSLDVSPFFSFFLCFLLPLYFIEYVSRACRIQYDDMTLHCPLLCLLHTWQRTPVVSPWRSVVITELVSLLLILLKNRQGHWLCWMSTGKKNGLM